MGARIVTALEVLNQHLKCCFSTYPSANLLTKNVHGRYGIRTGFTLTWKSTADVTNRPTEISLTGCNYDSIVDEYGNFEESSS